MVYCICLYFLFDSFSFRHYKFSIQNKLRTGYYSACKHDFPHYLICPGTWFVNILTVFKGNDAGGGQE